jgi:hypothetical protein
MYPSTIKKFKPMKRNKFTLLATTFFVGAICGISAFMLVSFARPAQSADPLQLPTISIADANKLFHNYFDTATLYKEKFKGVYIDRLQLQVMDSLARNKSLTGFRIYPGRSAKAEMVSILVGATSPTSIDVTGAVPKVYMTESRSAEPCPPLCDVSVITR